MTWQCLNDTRKMNFDRGEKDPRGKKKRPVNLTLFSEISQNISLSRPRKARVFWLVWRLFDYFLVFRVKLTLPSHSHLITAHFSTTFNKNPQHSHNIQQHHHHAKKIKGEDKLIILPRQKRLPLRLQLTQGQAPTKLRGRSSAPHPLRPIPVSCNREISVEQDC